MLAIPVHVVVVLQSIAFVVAIVLVDVPIPHGVVDPIQKFGVCDDPIDRDIPKLHVAPHLVRAAPSPIRLDNATIAIANSIPIDVVSVPHPIHETDDVGW